MKSDPGLPSVMCREFSVGSNYASSSACMTTDPWKTCPHAPECFSVFGNGICDTKCNTRACLFDGMDCVGQTPFIDRSECNPLYDDYCLARYADGHCDEMCKTKECGFDGLDCVDNSTHTSKALPGTVTITLDAAYEIANTWPRADLSRILRSLSSIVPGTVFEFKSLNRDPHTGKGVIELAVNQAVCDRGEACFESVIEVEEYFGALQSTKAVFSQPLPGSAMKITSVKAVGPYERDPSEEQSTTSNFTGYMAGAAILFMCVSVGVMYNTGSFSPTGAVGKMKKMRCKMIWFPEEFFEQNPHLRVQNSSSSRSERHNNPSSHAGGGDFYKARRGPRPDRPDGQEMANLSSSSNQHLMFKESPKAPTGMDNLGQQLDSIYDEPAESRSWTTQHIEAFTGRTPLSPLPIYDSMSHTNSAHYGPATSYPGTPMSPGSPGIDVRGPGGYTPLMVASAFDPSTMPCQQPLHAPSSTHPGSPGDAGVASPSTSCDVLTELINSGASLSKQSEIGGETPLHLAARYSRADAAKKLLDAGAKCNAIDFRGRTPLHAAVAADARGVFEILLRNRETNLNAQDDTGTTPLMLAAKHSMQDMLEDLIASEAQIDLTDNRGKTALHWAASVNNVSAISALLKGGANKDAQDNHEQTPLFLAARDGAKEAVQILLESGANRDITDHMDKLPRDVAAEKMNQDIVQILESSSPTTSNFASFYQQQVGDEHMRAQTLPKKQSNKRRQSSSDDCPKHIRSASGTLPARKTANKRSAAISTTTTAMAQPPLIQPLTSSTGSQVGPTPRLLLSPPSSSSPLSSTFSPSSSLSPLAASNSPYLSHAMSSPSHLQLSFAPMTSSITTHATQQMQPSTPFDPMATYSEPSTISSYNHYNSMPQYPYQQSDPSSYTNDQAYLTPSPGKLLRV